LDFFLVSIEALKGFPLVHSEPIITIELSYLTSARPASSTKKDNQSINQSHLQPSEVGSFNHLQAIWRSFEGRFRDRRR